MSTLKADTIQSTSGGAATLTKQSAAKMFAFVEYVSSGDSFSLTNSLNVSSSTDAGTGLNTITVTNAFANDDVATLGSSGYRIVGPQNTAAAVTTTSIQYILTNSSASASDISNDTSGSGASYTAHGDLA
jgi:hypothetical protein